MKRTCNTCAVFVVKKKVSDSVHEKKREEIFILVGGVVCDNPT